MIYEDADLKIEIEIKNIGNVLANATISIRTKEFGFITIKDLIVWKSIYIHERLNDYINITPPQRRNYKNIPLFFFESESKWFVIESKIYLAYKNAVEGEVRIEDIPQDLGNSNY